jgi:hypothetical protein
VEVGVPTFLMLDDGVFFPNYPETVGFTGPPKRSWLPL